MERLLEHVSFWLMLLAFAGWWIATPAHAAEPWPRWSGHDGAAYAFAAVIIIPTLALIVFGVLAKWSESRKIVDRHEHVDGEVP